MTPKDALYSKNHEWLRVEEDRAQLGITAYAQAELGEVVYVELPEVGQTFSAGDEIGTIESVKAVAEIYTPVGGEILAINEELEDAPEKVNEDPYGVGWLVEIRVHESEELAELMDAAAYEEFVSSDE